MALLSLSQLQLKVRLQQCYLESVADLSYVAMNVWHFLRKFSKILIENACSSSPEATRGHRGSKRRSKTTDMRHPKPPTIMEICNDAIWKVRQL